MKTIITFTRPNKEAPFFSLAAVPESKERSNLHLFLYNNELEKTMEHTDELSDDELTLVRTLHWRNPTVKEKFETEFMAKHAWFHKERAEYLEVHGHTMTVREEE